MADSEQSAAPVAAAPTAVRSLGEILKQARTARDLSLEQVSTELRIEVQQLDALEKDRFERIGVPVFVKGYLRQYATLLGLDVRDLLALYHKQTSLKEVQIQPSKTIRLRDERQITVWIIAAVIVAALIAALGVWWWTGGGLQLGTLTPASQTSTEPAAADSVAASPGTGVPAPAASSPPPEVAAAAGLPSTSTSTSVPTSTPAANGASNDLRQAAEPVAARAEEPPPAGAGSASEPDADERRGPSFTAALEVTFEQDSWTEISDARGQRLFYGLGATGRNAKFSGEPPFAVVLGNAAGVKIAIDGEDFPVPTNGKPGDYSRFSVDVAGD
jgi:cytoskeleton protein RodZ